MKKLLLLLTLAPYALNAVDAQCPLNGDEAIGDNQELNGQAPHIQPDRRPVHAPAGQAPAPAPRIIYEPTIFHLLNQRDFTALEAHVRRGKDINKRNAEGQTALHAAIENEDNRAIQFLIELGADLLALDAHGNAPFHLAAAHDNIGLIRLLLERHVPADIKNKYDETPLTIAHAYNASETIGLLTSHFALKHAIDTSLHVAAQRAAASSSAASAEQRPSVARQLMLAGLVPLRPQTPDTSDIFGMIRMGAVDDVIEYLRRHGINPNLCDFENITLLQAAIEGRNFGVAHFLLQHGARTNTRNHLGNTPLHIAVNTGNINMVQLLLHHGADTHARNGGRFTPLDLAQRCGYDDIAALL